jgi:hypothetical protein
MTELFRTILVTDSTEAELRLILVAAGDSRWLNLEEYQKEGSVTSDVPTSRVTLPLALWPRFFAAICCLGAFMKPLPAPAYQPRSCCSYTCAQTPEPVVLVKDSQEQIHLSLQDRRGSTFLEIKTIMPAVAKNSGEAQTIHLGPTIWSAFAVAVDRLNQFIAGL